MKGIIEKQRKAAGGELKIVGVNCFEMDEEPHQVEAFRHNPRAWEIAMERLEKLRQTRDEDKAQRCIADLQKACETGENVMPVMMKAVQSSVSADKDIAAAAEHVEKVLGSFQAVDAHYQLGLTISTKITEEVTRFRGKERPEDDLTFVVVKIEN